MIKLHIECNKEGNEKLAELGIESKGTEFRECDLNPEYIAFMYPNLNGGTFITIEGIEISTQESIDEIRLLIND